MDTVSQTGVYYKVELSDILKKLYIEPSSFCNLKCTMCFRKSWFDESLADMSMTVFSRIIETMPQSVESIFFGVPASGQKG